MERRGTMFDEHGNVIDADVCPPGGRLHIPCRFMDTNLPRELRPYVRRAFGLSDGDDADVRAAYDQRSRRMSNAWRDGDGARDEERAADDAADAADAAGGDVDAARH